MNRSLDDARGPSDVQGVAQRFIAPNAGPMTLQGTNTYIVGGKQVYVIDPGPDDARHLTIVVDWLRAAGRTVLGILLTHGHPDHALGAMFMARMLNTPIWAVDTAQYPLYTSTDHVSLRPDTTFRIDHDTLRVVPTPGHTPDSVSYLLEGARVIFTGDTILGQGSTVVAPPEGDMTSYVSSLETLRRLQASRLAPGHGSIVNDARSKIQEYIDHRHAREVQLVTALAEGPWSVPALVAQLYVDTPRALHQLAAGSVEAGLQKLEREGIVRHEGEEWSLLTGGQ
jgi:glyoxylase-like metal-dependent hydrolase (beta-lactamase superfamily II)